MFLNFSGLYPRDSCAPKQVLTISLEYWLFLQNTITVLDATRDSGDPKLDIMIFSDNFSLIWVFIKNTKFKIGF